MNDQTTWVILLSFGGLIIISIVVLFTEWRFASNGKRVLLATPLPLFITLLLSWDNLMEDLRWEKPISKAVPMFVGWPNYKETLTVISRSQQAANAPDTVITRCFNSFGDEIIVFHKDEQLRREDTVFVDRDGQVRIKRAVQLEVANQ